MLPRSLPPVLLALACTADAPGTGADAPGGTPDVAPQQADGRLGADRPLILVEWSVDAQDLLGDDGRPRSAEWLGRVAVTLEAELYRSAIPVGPGGRAPGITHTPAAETYQLSLRPDGPNRAEASFCGPDGTCEIHFATGSPEAIGTTLAAAALAQLDLPDTVSGCLSRPPSGDDYATLMTGRSAAIVYGWLPPSDAPDDPRVDPVARAVFLDPASATAQWLAGRVAWRDGDVAAAAEHLHFAARQCPEHQGWAADEALAFAMADDRRGAFPDDLRFVFARLDAGLHRGDPETYRRAVAAIGKLPSDPRLEARAASAAPEERVGYHLDRWAKLDKKDPTPVRWQARRALRDRAWRDLLQHCDELEKRGVDTARWRTPALLALGRIDAAARVAPADVQDRVRARAGQAPTGSSPEELLLLAQTLLPSDPTAALARCEEVLQQRPWWPEALALAADAARAAGTQESTYRNRLKQAEP